MNLNIFNPWRDLVKWSGLTLQYQTSKKGDTFTTYIREKESQQPITFGVSRTSKEESQQRASDALKRIGMEGVQRAIETGQMIRPTDSQPAPQKDIQWRDGVNHRYGAEKRLQR